MKIVRFIDSDGIPRHGRINEHSQVQPISGDFIEAGSDRGNAIDEVRLLAPVAPTNILCIGLNYKAHAAEAGMQLPRHPPLFMKPTTTITGMDDDIVIPAACEHGAEVDYEAELGVIIGRRARNVSDSTALSYVAGYTCATDVSARKWQMHAGGGQWVRGKSFDTFCPLGPHIVTPDEISDPQALDIHCRVNGETLQSGNTNDMIFSVAEIIAYLSRDTTLEPGTVILTGTPAGVGFARKPPIFLEDGDFVEVDISNIGTLRNNVIHA